LPQSLLAFRSVACSAFRMPTLLFVTEDLTVSLNCNACVCTALKTGNLARHRSSLQRDLLGRQGEKMLLKQLNKECKD